MAETDCDHKWSMCNVRNGYLIVEGCFHCRNRISFFSDEPVPPIDDYREGEHFWSHLGSFQASKFDLKCEKCGKEIALDDVMALMLCMNCDEECGVFEIAANEKDSKTWIYVALCADTSHASQKCISDEGIKALNQYFNFGIQDPDKKILVVPCSFRKSPDTCQGVVLADVGLTELY
ncbi:hypothetical protein AMJ86_01755 [bacterium SM23_57]|nr:MAG: hypothetical protein AMJ86_01755 [bacterium SM23_57]